MYILAVVIAICCNHAAQASYYGHHGGQQLEGIPDLESYSHISYPKYELLELGEYSKGYAPGDEIKITKHIKETIPQPYPVKIPAPYPVPVPVAKPYPVVETKIIKVPVPYPQIIEKKVPVHIEVPKPYPVPVHSEHQGGEGGGYGGDQAGWGSQQAPQAYGGNLGGHQAAYEGQGYDVQEQSALPSNEGDLGGGHQVSAYEAKAYQSDVGYGGDQGSEGWSPLHNPQEAEVEH